MLVGRETERADIDETLHRVRAGQGGGLVLLGEPGIGKTALLDYTAERATGMRVLRTVGVEPESDISNAMLHRLLLPVLDGIESLPEPQRRALQVVLGEAEGTSPDRFLVALAVLSLLADVAAGQPVLCLVDDAHWSDGPSLDTASFVARRLEAEPIAMVLAGRPDEGRRLRVDGLASMTLTGLDDATARALLLRHGGDRLSEGEQDHVLAAARGNPLALAQLSGSVMDGVDLNEPLALAAGLQEAFLRRVRRHPVAVRRLLLLVAVEGSGLLETIRRAAAQLEVEHGPLMAGELDDLLAYEQGRVSFRHPLIRAAVYHDAALVERQRAHGALAAVLKDEPGGLERRAWHLGKLTDGPDEAAAKELERAADQALTRAGPAAAAVALARAADLSASDEDRGRRLVAAADAAWQAGDTARVLELLDRGVRIGGLDEALGAKVAQLRALVEVLAGTPTDGLLWLRQAIPIALRDSRRRAMPLLLTFGEVADRSNSADAATELAEWLEPLRLDGDDPSDLLGRLLRASCVAQLGGDPSVAPGDREAVEGLHDPVDLVRAGWFTWVFGQAELGRRMLRKAERQARALGAAGTLAWTLEHLVLDEVSHSRFGRADAHAEEGYRLAVETGQPNTACRHQSWLTLLAALRGRAEEANQRAREVLAVAGEHELHDASIVAYRALGLLDLLAGQYDEALGHLEAMDYGDVTTNQCLYLLDAMPDRIEAAVRAGQRDRAAEAYGRFATWAHATRSVDRRALAARCRALLASGAEAEDEYRRSLDLYTRTDQPLEHARTALLLGQHLRRARKPSDARPHLRTALETFRRIGAEAWADHAASELRAAGETDTRPDKSGLALLTPQELNVALAVSEGITDREAAARLFLSPRTIDYHLRKVFQKLGISSRSELIRLVLAENTDEHGT